MKLDVTSIKNLAMPVTHVMKQIYNDLYTYRSNQFMDDSYSIMFYVSDGSVSLTIKESSSRAIDIELILSNNSMYKGDSNNIFVNDNTQGKYTRYRIIGTNHLDEISYNYLEQEIYIQEVQSFDEDSHFQLSTIHNVQDFDVMSTVVDLYNTTRSSINDSFALDIRYNKSKDYVLNLDDVLKRVWSIVPLIS